MDFRHGLLELAQHNHVYEDIATKFFEHFLDIAKAMTNIGGHGIGLWDEEDGFYYDVLNLPNGMMIPLKVRSMVGLIPLFAVETLEPDLLRKLPEFSTRMEWYLSHRPDLASLVSRWHEAGQGERRLLSLLRGGRMKKLLRRMLDESEFLSEFGVGNIPANVKTPFGLVTSGNNNAYVTIAHADELSLVRNGQVLTTPPTSSLPGPIQHSPCWVTLVGPFLYSSNSPSFSVSRYAVYGQKIVPDLGVAASFNGAPTDITSGAGLVAVIDGRAGVSHLSVFQVDEDGNLTLRAVTTIGSAINGVAIVAPTPGDDN